MNQFNMGNLLADDMFVKSVTSVINDTETYHYDINDPQRNISLKDFLKQVQERRI